MDNFDIRTLGAVFSALGSLILAIRVANIVYAISSVLEMHDSNFKNIHEPTPVIAINSSKWVKKAKGLRLLVLGFLFLIWGAVCQAIGFWNSTAQ